VRPVATDSSAAWLRGPHEARLVTDLYSPVAPELFLTPVELPKFFDAMVFVHHVTPAHQ